MPAIFNAQITELGDVYQVVNIFLTETKYFLPNAIFMDLPNEVALKLKNELNQGKYITIKKELVDSPKSKDIPLSDFNIEIPKSLDQKKNAIKTKINSRISGYTAKLAIFDMFEFMFLIERLRSYGYNILDENKREEMQIDIIGTQDEELIGYLEKFLELKTIYYGIIDKYRGLREYLKEIDNCDTEEELEEVINSNKGWLIN